MLHMSNNRGLCQLRKGRTFRQNPAGNHIITQPLKRIASYDRAQTMDKKFSAAIKKICDAGLNKLYCGMESGSKKVLKLVKKGITHAHRPLPCVAGARRRLDITAMGGPYSDLVLPTTKHERVLDLSTLSYKTLTSAAATIAKSKRWGQSD